MVIYDCLFSVTSRSSLEDRTFETRSWYKKYQDNITPAGLAFYQTHWDKSVTGFFHDVLQRKEPGDYSLYFKQIGITF